MNVKLCALCCKFVCHHGQAPTAPIMFSPDVRSAAIIWLSVSVGQTLMCWLLQTYLPCTCIFMLLQAALGINKGHTKQLTILDNLHGVLKPVRGSSS